MSNLPNHHLEQFAQQLAIWTKEIIEHGRTPFRRVDTYPHIDTEQGVLQPPLVFWINRQSMMAGGVLLLPDNNLEIELEHGRHCVSALGLHHFVTWETDRVRIWQVDRNQTQEQQSFPLSSPSQPETFRYLLADILESLKLLAVLGATPVADLSPHYFNNLFQATLQQALPPLVKAYRRQRSEEETLTTEDADACANEANRLLILQVISLLWFDKFPDTIMPEKIDRAIELSLPALPNLLKRALSYKTTIEPPPLPLETAICFHHLLLRLRQLSWKQPTERAKKSIYYLLNSWYRNKSKKIESAPVNFYPAKPPLDTDTTVILSDSPSLLAATEIWANISTHQQYNLFWGNLFQFDRDNFPSQKIVARLLNHTGIPSSARHEYTTRLRITWPNRRLKIKTGQPFWLWELVHLLGLCHVGQKLSLEIPADLVNKSESMIAWALLCEGFSFRKIQCLDGDNLVLHVSHNKTHGEPFPLQLSEEIRRITPFADPGNFRNQLRLALTLPKEIYNLLGKELIWPEPAGIPRDHLPGWELYCQSHLYKWLRTILQSDQSPATPEPEGTTNTHDYGVPYPEPFVLEELLRFQRGLGVNHPPASIDQFLASLLACPAIKNIKPAEIGTKSKPKTPGIHSGKKIKETITQQLVNHGIPNFPEQYLYFLDQPKICHYSIAHPLKVKSHFLGQFELEDARGQIITGYGEELEQSLLFCSFAGKTEFDLPSDRHQIEQLLDYYKKDLISLYKHLSNLCYSQIENSKSAHQLVKKIWGTFNLPAPAWFNK